MDDRQFSERFARHIRLPRPDEAQRALVITLQALAPAMDRHAIDAVRAELPPSLGAGLDPTDDVRSLTPEDVYAQVAGQLGLEEGRAVELVQMVLEGLASVCEPQLVTRLRRELGEAFDPLLQPRGPFPDPPADAHHGDASNLASGHPGSSHPLSEAHPAKTQHDSVAAPNPHGDTKLSSATDTRHAPPAETLATGKPRR